MCMLTHTYGDTHTNPYRKSNTIISDCQSDYAFCAIDLSHDLQP